MQSKIKQIGLGPYRGALATSRALVFSLLFAVAPLIASGQELLVDGDLEASRPDGTFPTSGFWQPAYLGEAGSIVIGNAGVTGNAFYIYTGSPGDDFWAAPYQEVVAIPGQVFEGSAFIRSPIGNTNWVTGSSARVHVAFLDANTNVLTSFESSAMVVPSPGWQKFQISTEAAPLQTAFVRYMCVLEKPRGLTNISVAVFDNCSLRAGIFTGVETWPLATGIATGLRTAEVNIRNSGNTALVWYATNIPAWLAVTPNTATISPGVSQKLLLTVSRSLLAGTDVVKGSFQIAWGNRTAQVRVFVEMPAPPVPGQPALVRVDGRRVVVQERLVDGTLASPVNYAVRGVTWSPSSRETPDVFELRRDDYAKWFVTDTQLLRELNANTVYTFLDFGTNDLAQHVLDNLYRNGIKALVTVDENGTGNTNTLSEVIAAYRNHPAILGWVIGNEWNINLYHGRFQSQGYLAAAAFTEQLARMVKQLDTNHFVLSTHGDIYPPEMSELANELCPSVDVWGLNVYRGSSFTTLFDDWAGITGKPMMLTEFGTDAYRTLMLKINADGAIVSADGAIDEQMQANWDRGLWREIVPHLSAEEEGGICLGATVFEWTDEWWKAQSAFGGEVGRHENLGFYASWNPKSHPDGVANEEWWGLVTVDREPRMSFRYFQQDFGAVRAEIQRTTTGQPSISWPARSNVVYTVYYRDGDLRRSGPFAPLRPFTNLTSTTNGILRIVDTNTVAGPRFYRVVVEQQ